MNRKQRRAMSSRKLKSHLAEIQEDGKGVMQLTIFYREDIPDILLQAALGDEFAARCMFAVKTSLAQIETQQPLCLLCDVLPTRDTIRGIALFAGAVDSPKPALANIICESCVERLGDRNAVARAARDYYVANIVNLRAIDVLDQSGNA